MRSILIGTLGLDVAAVAAIWMTISRHRILGTEREVSRATRAGWFALSLQAAHFAEELASGFGRRFPAQLGLSAWPDGFFVSFNLFWLLVWSLAIVGLRGRRPVALFPLWFLGIAGVANAIAHPLLAIAAGGYFPGVATSTFVGVAGILLLRDLWRITASDDGRRTAPDS